MIRGESKKLVNKVDDILTNGHVYNHEVLDEGNKPFYFAMHREEENYRLYVTMVIKNTMKVFHKLVAESAWLGSGSFNNTKYIEYDPFVCNTVLFVSGKTCTWLGESCCSFELEEGEEVVRFVSTVCHGWTPYGWIETNTSYIGLYGFSCDTYRITKTPQVEKWIKSEKLLLSSPDINDKEVKALMRPLKLKILCY